MYGKGCPVGIINKLISAGQNKIKLFLQVYAGEHMLRGIAHLNEIKFWVKRGNGWSLIFKITTLPRRKNSKFADDRFPGTKFKSNLNKGNPRKVFATLTFPDAVKLSGETIRVTLVGTGNYKTRTYHSEIKVGWGASITTTTTTTTTPKTPPRPKPRPSPRHTTEPPTPPPPRPRTTPPPPRPRTTPPPQRPGTTPPPSRPTTRPPPPPPSPRPGPRPKLRPPPPTPSPRTRPMPRTRPTPQPPRSRTRLPPAQIQPGKRIKPQQEMGEENIGEGQLETTEAGSNTLAIGGAAVGTLVLVIIIGICCVRNRSTNAETKTKQDQERRPQSTNESQPERKPLRKGRSSKTEISQPRNSGSDSDNSDADNSE